MRSNTKHFLKRTHICGVWLDKWFNLRTLFRKCKLGTDKLASLQTNGKNKKKMKNYLNRIFIFKYFFLCRRQMVWQISPNQKIYIPFLLITKVDQQNVVWCKVEEHPIFLVLFNIISEDFREYQIQVETEEQSTSFQSGNINMLKIKIK